MKEDIENLNKRYSTITESIFNETIKKLPDQMQETLKCIYRYGKTKNKKGMRYSKEWILECILLRIKSRTNYLHLKLHNILPLPTISTLRTYMENMKPRYGFDKNVFSMLKKVHQ